MDLLRRMKRKSFCLGLCGTTSRENRRGWVDADLNTAFRVCDPSLDPQGEEPDPPSGSKARPAGRHRPNTARSSCGSVCSARPQFAPLDLMRTRPPETRCQRDLRLSGSHILTLCVCVCVCVCVLDIQVCADSLRRNAHAILPTAECDVFYRVVGGWV